eukprot:COSAG02_NODE_21_length_53083_cov_95.733618_6_plen_479_part_00
MLQTTDCGQVDAACSPPRQQALRRHEPAPPLRLLLPPALPQHWMGAPAGTALAWRHRLPWPGVSDGVALRVVQAPEIRRAQPEPEPEPEQLGLFATRRFIKGQLVLEERPTLVVDTVLSDDEVTVDGQRQQLSALWQQWAQQLAAFATLGWKERAVVLALWHPASGSPGAQALDIAAFLSFLHCAAGAGSAHDATLAAARVVPRSTAARVILIVRCNSFQWGEVQHAVLPHSSRINHSCEPNLIHQQSSDDGGTLQLSARRRGWQGSIATGERSTGRTAAIQFFAVRDIAEGDELTHDYLGLPLLSTAERQQRLEETKYFLCTCKACKACCAGETADVGLLSSELDVPTAVVAAERLRWLEQQLTSLGSGGASSASLDLAVDAIDWLWDWLLHTRCVTISPVWYIGPQNVRSLARALGLPRDGEAEGDGGLERRWRAVELLREVLAQLPANSAAHRDTSLELVLVRSSGRGPPSFSRQ